MSPFYSLISSLSIWSLKIGFTLRHQNLKCNKETKILQADFWKKLIIIFFLVSFVLQVVHLKVSLINVWILSYLEKNLIWLTIYRFKKKLSKHLELSDLMIFWYTAKYGSQIKDSICLGAKFSTSSHFLLNWILSLNLVYLSPIKGPVGNFTYLAIFYKDCLNRVRIF